jgi:hypothetical protein
MVRTQIYLTEEEKRGLESVAATRGMSQSDVIRTAIDELLARTGPVDRCAVLDGIAGTWAHRTDLPDIRSLRTGWRRRASR